jgi:hypothetical protein
MREQSNVQKLNDQRVKIAFKVECSGPNERERERQLTKYTMKKAEVSWGSKTREGNSSSFMKSEDTCNGFF